MPTDRSQFRDLEDHAGWREVYAQLDVDPDQHEEVADSGR